MCLGTHDIWAYMCLEEDERTICRSHFSPSISVHEPQRVRLGSKSLYPLRHLIKPHAQVFMESCLSWMAVMVSLW